MSILEIAQVSKLSANWPAPKNIVAFTTLRTGGFSQAPFDSLNMGYHVGDSPTNVTKNRELLTNSSKQLKHVQWLNQIHGNQVIEARASSNIPDADACYTKENALGCAIMTADCLPILVCDDSGDQVAAVHAGWRGAASGVVENTIKTFSADAQRLLVWLGPAISRKYFEVGPEVRQTFIDAAPESISSEIASAFYPNSRRSDHYFADLYQLVRIRLIHLGITRIYGAEHCCFDDHQQFFSYRRDQTTGRMVSLIYKYAR